MIGKSTFVKELLALLEEVMRGSSRSMVRVVSQVRAWSCAVFGLHHRVSCLSVLQQAIDHLLQDELGNRQKCVNAARDAVRQGRNMIIDRYRLQFTHGINRKLDAGATLMWHRGKTGWKSQGSRAVR